MKILVGLFVVLFALGMRVSATPNISAQIAVVMCYETGEVLYDRNMEQRWIPSSMTKIMTAFITYQEIEAGNLTLNTNVRVSANAATFSQNRRIEGSFVPLQQGNITVEMLLRLMMLPSSNGAAVVLAEHISGTEAAFVERMNETAYELGMYASFTNSHGAIAHHSNAYSIALLMREFIRLYPDILRITAMQTVTHGGTTYNNTNRLLFSNHYFSGADGFKTGVIRASGWGHSTTAVRDGRRVIAVLMNTTSNDRRQNESRILLQFGFDELARRDAAAAARVRVFNGGRAIPLDAPAVLDRGQLFLPMGDVLRALGFRLTWDGASRVATATDTDGSQITIFVDRNIATVRGTSTTLRTPARMVDNRVYIPLEIIQAITGTQTSWDFETGVVQI